MASFDPNNPLTKALMQSAAESMAATPTVQQNRARAAAVAYTGYETLGMYYQFRPVLFSLSAAGAALSFAMLYRRPKNTEAVTLYSLAGLLSSGVAWFTRPAMFRPAPAPTASTAPKPKQPGAPAAPQPKPDAQSAAMAEYLGALDSKVQKLNAEVPGWEANTYMRLANDLGFGTMYPPLQTALTRYGG